MARIVHQEFPDAGHTSLPELSGGMYESLASARAPMANLKIVRFDGPATGQEPIMKNAIVRLIVQNQRRFGVTRENRR